MKRLTDEMSAGNYGVLNCGANCKYDNKYCYTHNCPEIERAIQKLGEYEDAEEQGLLIRLPCKVGDTVYEPRPDRGFISVYEITLITISGTNIFYKWMLVDGIYSNLDGFSNDKIGKAVFLTYEEAERKLKELQKDSVYNEQIS